MLSRTADNLFWLARYIERAENLARLIEMGRWVRATSRHGGDARNEWPAILAASGCAQHFSERHDVADQWPAIIFLMLDRDNPSSILSCFEAARSNARAARAALTVEMWEAVNDAWIELRALSPSQLENGSMSPLLDWIKQRGALLRGAADSTALRNDGYDFLKLGFYAERFDSTARLLDVRSRGDANPSEGDTAAEHYEWVALLRAADVLRAYHAVYCADYHPSRIMDFLILNRHCPRSLAHCAERITDHLDNLGRYYVRRDLCHMAASGVTGLLREASVDDILRDGLTPFLSDVIRRNNGLALSIARAYHFAPEPVTPEAVRDASTASSSTSSGLTQTSSTLSADAATERLRAESSGQEQSMGRVSGVQAQHMTHQEVAAE